MPREANEPHKGDRFGTLGRSSLTGQSGNAPCRANPSAILADASFDPCLPKGQIRIESYAPLFLSTPTRPAPGTRVRRTIAKRSFFFVQFRLDAIIFPPFPVEVDVGPGCHTNPTADMAGTGVAPNEPSRQDGRDGSSIRTNPTTDGSSGRRAKRRVAGVSSLRDPGSGPSTPIEPSPGLGTGVRRRTPATPPRSAPRARSPRSTAGPPSTARVRAR